MREGILSDDLKPLVVRHVVRQRGEHRQGRVLLFVIHLKFKILLVKGILQKSSPKKGLIHIYLGRSNTVHPIQV